jgi:hypothetical protein
VGAAAWRGGATHGAMAQRRGSGCTRSSGAAAREREGAPTAYEERPGVQESKMVRKQGDNIMLSVAIKRSPCYRWQMCETHSLESQKNKFLIYVWVVEESVYSPFGLWIQSITRNPTAHDRPRGPIGRLPRPPPETLSPASFVFVVPPPPPPRLPLFLSRLLSAVHFLPVAPPPRCLSRTDLSSPRQPPPPSGPAVSATRRHRLRLEMRSRAPRRPPTPAHWMSGPARLRQLLPPPLRRPATAT